MSPSRSRRRLIAANWKLQLGPKAAAAHATAIRDRLLAVEDVDLAVFPTAMSVPAVVEVLKGSNLRVGAQWASAHAEGAYTGANSPAIAREIGCGWVLCGHSEVRGDFGETDARVHGALRGALKHGLLPMLCVGESVEERAAGKLREVLERQLDVAFGSLHADEAATVTVAYEPLWAIGTGVVATPDKAQEAHAVIRRWLLGRFPEFVAAQVRVLYGGSVKPSNIAGLLACPDVDGALVGGASLDVEAFCAIVDAARR